MFERFTPEVHSAIFAARWIAEASGGTEIRPEHLVAGVLSVVPGCLGSDQTAAILTQLGYSEGLASRPAVPASYIPFSESTKSCLTVASARADSLGHRWVRSEHLLASILLDATTDAAQVLLAAGVSCSALEATALARPPADTDSFSGGPTMHAFVTPSKGRSDDAV